MVNSSSLHKFEQSFNSCILVSYAIVSNHYTKIGIEDFFIAYCNHFKCPKPSDSVKLKYRHWGFVFTDNNENEFRYELDFHARYGNGKGNGLQIIENLHNHSHEMPFVYSRNQFTIQYFSNVNDRILEIEKKLVNEDSLLILAFKGEVRGRHIATFGYDINGLYTIETRPQKNPGTQYIQSISKLNEPGDAFLATRKNNP
jgi:hypothetical protein